MVHRSGTEGWMGPLAVRTEFQGSGTGKEIVTRAASNGSWAVRRVGDRARDDAADDREHRILFASGISSGSVSRSRRRSSGIAWTNADAQLIGRLSPAARGQISAGRVPGSGEPKLLPGRDYTREINLTNELALGDTVLLYDRDWLVGFALAHTAPLVEGRAREELRVLKLVVDDESRFDELLRAIADFARRSGTRRIALRLQGEFPTAYQRVIALGGHVRWTDLRMSLGGFTETPSGDGIGHFQLGDLERPRGEASGAAARSRFRPRRAVRGAIFDTLLYALTVDPPRLTKPPSAVPAEELRL